MPISRLIRWGRGLSSACPSDPAGGVTDSPTLMHASCVALDGRGLLILGASGAGKSALALHLMALGAGLVADDRCHLTRRGAQVMVSAPPAIRGRIEARYVGILRVAAVPGVPLALIVDLTQTETARLPPPRRMDVLGLQFPVLHNVALSYFPAAILQYMRQMDDNDGE